ncbi:signal peptidase II, partial [Vibrio parahaemolyticus]
ALTPFLKLVLAQNKGISYGLLPLDSLGGQLFLAAFQIVAAMALWLWLVRTEFRLTTIAIGLIIGGALGNALDRLIH